MIQLAIPRCRSSAGLKKFSAEMKAVNHDLFRWDASSLTT